MQLIFALPFVGFALIAFVVCLIVPRWRSYSIRALVAPVAFGGCSLVGLLIGVLAADFAASLLHARESVRNALPYFGLLLFPAGGAGGAYLAVIVVHFIEVRLSPRARERLLRGVTGLVVLAFVSLMSLVAGANLLPHAQDTGPFLLIAAASGLIGLMAGCASYWLSGKIWRETFSVE